MPRRHSAGRVSQIREINMTPLIDLTFLLLITFMITFPLVEQGIPLRLPKGKAQDVEKQDSSTVAVNDKEELFFDDLPVTPEMLSRELEAKAAADPDATILVRADESLAYGKVVAVLRILHDAGISRMALVTDPVE